VHPCRADRQVDVGDLRGSESRGSTTISSLSGSFARRWSCRGAWGSDALHAVPSQDEEHIRVVHVRLIVQVLASVRAAADPEGAGEFLRQGAVLILRANPA